MDPRNPDVTSDLVHMAQHGDRAALDTLLERYQRRVLGVVRRRLGRKLRRDLDSRDIVQESLAVAVRKLDSFEMRHEASLIAWLRKIVERKIGDAADRQRARKRDRDREVSIDVTGDSSHDVAVRCPGTESESPLVQMVRQEEQEMVESYLAELPEPYRDLILLRNYEAFDWQRIAEMTDRPSADAARMMYAKALLELGRVIRRRRLGDTAEDRVADDSPFASRVRTPPEEGCEP